MKEMVYQVGRERAASLRIITVVLGFVIPGLILLLWLFGSFSHWLIIVAALAQFAGTVASRWLFFAEANHAVGLYYGQR